MLFTDISNCCIANNYICLIYVLKYRIYIFMKLYLKLSATFKKKYQIWRVHNCFSLLLLIIANRNPITWFLSALTPRLINLISSCVRHTHRPRAVKSFEIHTHVLHDWHVNSLRWQEIGKIFESNFSCFFFQLGV